MALAGDRAAGSGGGGARRGGRRAMMNRSGRTSHGLQRRIGSGRLLPGLSRSARECTTAGDRLGGSLPLPKARLAALAVPLLLAAPLAAASPQPPSPPDAPE